MSLSANMYQQETFSAWRYHTAPLLSGHGPVKDSARTRSSSQPTSAATRASNALIANLYSLTQDLHVDRAFDPMMIESIPTKTALTLPIIAGVTLTASSAWLLARPMFSMSRQAQPQTFTGTLEVDWSCIGRKFDRFADEHGEAVARAAYMKEVNGIIAAGVVSIPVELPQGQIAPKATMLIGVKSDGTVKARLVYRGDLQVEGLNFDGDNLYAPVLDRVSMRLLLAIGAVHHAFIHSMDVNLAFLYGSMDDELYMSPPTGIVLPPGKVWKVLKSLYGTKQAPQIWHSVIKTWFESQGFVATTADRCVFVKRAADLFIFIGLHVDDLLIVTNSEEFLLSFKTAIISRFSMKDQGTLTGREFTGCHVEYDQKKGEVALSCDRSVKKLLVDLKFDESNPYNTPISNDKTKPRDLSPAECPLSKKFASICGHLNWLSVLCRPDISYAASMLAGCNWECPTVGDMIDAKRLLRYLRSTLTEFPRMGVKYIAHLFSSIKQALIPVTFVDSDLAGNPSGGPATQKSRTGQIIYTAAGPLFWKSSKQVTIAMSSSYAEVIALSDCCKKLVWIIALMKCLSFLLSKCPVYEDNESAITIIKSIKQNEGSRHYHIRFLWTKELCERGIIDLLKINTKDNIADFFTKRFGIDETLSFISAIMHRPLDAKYYPKVHTAGMSTRLLDYDDDDDEGGNNLQLLLQASARS